MNQDGFVDPVVTISNNFLANSQLQAPTNLQAYSPQGNYLSSHMTYQNEFPIINLDIIEFTIITPNYKFALESYNLSLFIKMKSYFEVPK